MLGEFHLLDNEGNRRIIDRYEPDVGKKTLGVCLSMDGTDSTQFDSLLAEAKKFASQIWSSSVNWDFDSSDGNCFHSWNSNLELIFHLVDDPVTYKN